MKTTQKVWIEKKVALEFYQKKRNFNFMIYPEKTKYVEDHKDSFVQVKMTMEFKLCELNRGAML